jgi:hypothetical protein
VLLAPRRPAADGAINDAPLWRQSHVDGLEIHSGLDAKSVECASKHCPARSRPISRNLVRNSQSASSLLATLSFVIRHPRRPDAVVLEQAVGDTPQVKAPCAPPLCRARLISLVSPREVGASSGLAAGSLATLASIVSAPSRHRRFQKPRL